MAMRLVLIVLRFFVPLYPVKHILLIIAYLILFPFWEVGRSFTQTNLVPNPSFESKSIKSTYEIVMLPAVQKRMKIT